MRKIGIPESYLNDTWTPFREKYFDYDRIDFVIESGQFCAAVEMKIGASDGDRHLLNTKKNPRSVWFYLQNSGGEVINFKDFSISAVKQIDESEVQGALNFS